MASAHCWISYQTPLRHMVRNPSSKARVKLCASIRGELSSRERSDRRNVRRECGWVANATLRTMRSVDEVAINSGAANELRRLKLLRATAVLPASATTGTPIHSVSSVVVAPL